MSENTTQTALETQKSQIPEETSRRITALRFLLAVLVVFIHNNYTTELIASSVARGEKDILFNQTAAGKWIQLFISAEFGRCAVPLFFLFAAYLQAKKADYYGVLLKKKAKGLLAPYILWMAIYAVYFCFGKLIVIRIAPGLIINPDKNVFSYSFKDWIYGFIGFSTAAATDGNPLFAGQFWFVRDLLIFSVISPLFLFLMKKIPAAFFAAVAFCYLFTNGFAFDRHFSDAVFYYVCGLYWGTYDARLLEKIDKIKWPEMIFIFVAMVVLEQNVFAGNRTFSKFMTIASCILILKFSAVIIRSERLFSATKYFAGFSFFLYAIHMPALLTLLQTLWLHLFPMKNGFFCLFEYFGVSLLTIFIGTGLGIALKKICPPLFGLLNGGRK